MEKLATLLTVPLPPSKEVCPLHLGADWLPAAVHPLQVENPLSPALVLNVSRVRESQTWDLRVGLTGAVSCMPKAEFRAGPAPAGGCLPPPGAGHAHSHAVLS